jgi:hypothetical protein
MFVHVFALVYVVAVLVVTFIAWSAMISKSGYVKWWVLAPLVPVVTTLVTLAIKFHQTKSFLKGGSFSFSQYGVMRWVDIIGLTVAWILFLIFAFSPWPGLGAGESFVPRARPGATGVGRSASMNTLGTSTSRPPVSGAAGTSAPSARATGGVDTRRRIYCAWCAEAIPGNRALGHDCGPKDRPEVYCRFCGKAFPEGTDLCPSCDA